MTNINYLRILAIVSFALITNSVKSQSNFLYTLQGEVHGIPDHSKILILSTSKNGAPNDTIEITYSIGSKFNVSSEVSQIGDVRVLRIDTGETENNKKKAMAVPFIVDDSKLAFTATTSSWPILSFTNSKENVTYFTLIDSIRNINKDYKSKLDYSRSDPSISSEALDSINEVLDSIYKNDIKQVLSNKASALAIPILFDKFIDFYTSKEATDLFNSLSPTVRNSPYGVRMAQQIDYQNARESIKVGETIPDFWVKNSKGDSARILSIAAQSKLTLIDFWASWCVPCREEIPNLKFVYEKYKVKGLNILGISSDSKVTNWQKAIKEDQTNWQHGIDVQKKIVRDLFKIKSIPAYILIDQNGKLLALDCTISEIIPFGPKLRGEELSKTIEKLL